ncbi:MAG: protein-glutamate O-methyltransferase CheR [Mariprofundaceae bacterium]|nr:protein-glutamate O-methyltransferase CheR [Mariprofundaceae bacterium]
MIEDIELTLLLEGIYQKYGHDFRDYARASIKRRIKRHMMIHKLETISLLQDRVLHHAEAMDQLLLDISVYVTEMFRDAEFYRVLRQEVIPVLHTFPLFNIWHAGCSTGEEVYSLAILLLEAGLLDRARIYATDINEKALKIAREGIYPLSHIKSAIHNYHAAGGCEDFSEYYVARYGNVIFKPSLKDKITFCNHNLATDGPFQEFEIILCRNVMIYFNTELKTKVLGLMHQSLRPLGLLAVGQKESVHLQGHFQAFNAQHRIYRKSN